VSSLACLALAACGESEQRSQAGYVAEDAVAVAPSSAPAPMPPTDGDYKFAAGRVAIGGASGPAQQSGESYVYDHSLVISMASEHIKARFERARDRCQNDAALKCKITNASFRLVGEPDAPLPIANLSVALPHDSVAPFEEGLLTLLPGEEKDDVFIRARNTNAQNVTNQVRDIESRLSQLTNYRDRMTELSKRGGAKTDDLIKIEAEISRTQSEIEQIEGQRRDLADRIAKENLSISFEAQSTVADAFQPIREVWQDSLRLLGQSAAAAIGFLVAIIPWIPVVVLGFFGMRWLWRRMRRAKA
jgi:hypothetical protein